MPSHRTTTKTACVTATATSAATGFAALIAISAFSLLSTPSAAISHTYTHTNAHAHDARNQLDLATPPTLEQRLEALAAALEERRIAEHIPGMAIAIVHNGQVVMAQGFGVANLETKEPVTADTLFCIGSTTKCFTSALVARLADRELLSFEDLAVDRVPGLRFRDPETHASATIADLLSHRTGLTRMTLLWYNGTAEPKDIIERVQAAENYAPFRQAFLYNNVMYLAAGVACEYAVNNANSTNQPATWASLIESELLRPLGMESTLALTPPAGTPGLAVGYNWDKDQKRNNPQILRDLRNIAPAGSIVSSANDMTRWITFQLGAGTVEGQTIVSEHNLSKTRTPHPNAEETTGYALGLFLDEWNGTPYFQHGGNIDGFASAFSFMPEHNIGLSLLMNITGSGLQNSVHDLVFTHLIADTIPGAPGTVPFTPGQLERFAGEYLFTPPGPAANDAGASTWTASVQNGRLYLDVPGQTNYELLFPDENGFWAFAVAPSQIRVTFKQEDDDKPATQLTLHQGGMEIVLPRKGTTINYAAEPGAIDAESLTQYLGVYRLDQLGDVTFSITDGALSVDVPGQTNFILNWPNSENRWTLRAVPNAAIEFDDITEGKTYREAFTLHQGGMKLRATRADDGPGQQADARPLPSLDDIMSRRHAHNTRSLKTDEPGRIIYTFKLVHQGIEGTIINEFEGAHAIRTHTDIGVFGQQTAIILGNTGRETSSFTDPKELSQKQADLARLAYPTAFAAPDLRETLTDLRVTAAREIDGRNAAVLAFTLGTADNSTILIDTETGDVIELRTFIDTGIIGTIPVTMKFPEWTTTQENVRIPQTITVDTVMTGLNRMTLQSATLGASSGMQGLAKQLEQELAQEPTTQQSGSETPQLQPSYR